MLPKLPSFRYSLYRILPRQLCPSPMNPGLQEHLNDPSVFLHVALSLLQLWGSSAHSSMSNMNLTDCNYDINWE